MFLPADRVYRLSHMLHDNYQTLHEQGEASFGLSPRHFDLKHTVLRTLHAWNPGMEKGLELAGVEMTLNPGRCMIPASQLASTGRTSPSDTGSMINMVIHLAYGCVQLYIRGRSAPEPANTDPCPS